MSLIRALVSQIGCHRFEKGSRLYGYELVRNDRGEPKYSVGNNSVIFRLRRGDSELMMKCYTRHKPHIEHIYPDKLLKEEILFEWGRVSQRLDVVIDRWIDGVTLDVAAKEAAERFDISKIDTLSRNFDLLARELLQSEIAHGDLKPENIVVDKELNMHLIDWDAMYRPELSHLKATELGTSCYNHPTREDRYDRWIDHYAAALISVELRLLYHNPLLKSRFGRVDGMILSSERILSQREEFRREYQHMLDTLALAADAIHYRMAKSLQSNLYRIDVEPLFNFATVNKFTMDPYTQPELYYDCGRCGFRYGYRLVTPPIYDEGFDFREGVATVRLGNHWHWIDRLGRRIMTISCCEKAMPPRNGKARYLCGGEWVELELPTL